LGRYRFQLEVGLALQNLEVLALESEELVDEVRSQGYDQQLAQLALEHRLGYLDHDPLVLVSCLRLDCRHQS
jgi:hypothetical protein